MERYIGIDVHAASCTIAVISEAGKKLKDFPVETNGQALVEAIRMIPGHKHLLFEEGLQSAWLYEQFDFLAEQKKQAERDLLGESRKHPIVRMLETAPGSGPCPKSGNSKG
jgi:hypothetical protein